MTSMTRKEYKEWIDSLFPVVIPKGMKTCPECSGEGEVEFERAVVDWNHGGYIDGYMDTCPTCEGDGFVAIEEDDE
jgi:DnaJ-class molecular chaperone